MFAQGFSGGGRIFDSFREVETLIKLKGFLPFRFGLIGQHNYPLLAPKQVRTDGHKSPRRVPITHLPHVGVDAKDFLQHDNARAVATGRQSEIGVKLLVIERPDLDHLKKATSARSFIREVDEVGESARKITPRTVVSGSLRLLE